MEFLIRFVQVHEGFRRPEIHALADLLNVPIAFLTYSEDSPFSIVRLPSEASAAALISRSILTHAIYSLIGSGSTYPDLHDLIRTHAIPQWPSSLLKSSFKFNVDAYRGKHDLDAQRALIESFSYLPISGPIRMRDPACEFVISEDWSFEGRELRQVYLGRLVASSQRHEALSRYDLKKRTYISTTSMDSELALVTANLTLAGPGKLFYDPFVGTGSFPIACAHFGAMAVGSDIDGRSVRGKKKEKGGEGGMMGTKPKNDKNIVGNFRQYGLQGRWLGGFIADLTNCPLRVGRGGEDTPLFDGIVCDPPYGVREGLKVLGSRDGRGTKEAVFIDGKAAHLADEYIPPKRPYSFEAMLEDILEFAALSLGENGRLSLWMPTANDEEVELDIPAHPYLELVSACTQVFNKWSRRLLTYRRLPDAEVVKTLPLQRELLGEVTGFKANDLNSFRKRYFEGFRAPKNGEADHIGDSSIINSKDESSGH